LALSLTREKGPSSDNILERIVSIGAICCHALPHNVACAMPRRYHERILLLDRAEAALVINKTRTILDYLEMKCSPSII
jgi:hypothetical protein